MTRQNSPSKPRPTRVRLSKPDPKLAQPELQTQTVVNVPSTPHTLEGLPTYRLPDELEAQARLLEGSQVARVCAASAVAIRNLICEINDLRLTCARQSEQLTQVRSIVRTA